MFYRQKPAKESVKGELPYVLCINVQSLNFLQAANLTYRIYQSHCSGTHLFVKSRTLSARCSGLSHFHIHVWGHHYSFRHYL